MATCLFRSPWLFRGKDYVFAPLIVLTSLIARSPLDNGRSFKITWMSSKVAPRVDPSLQVETAQRQLRNLQDLMAKTVRHIPLLHHPLRMVGFLVLGRVFVGSQDFNFFFRHVSLPVTRKIASYSYSSVDNGESEDEQKQERTVGRARRGEKRRAAA